MSSGETPDDVIRKGLPADWADVSRGPAVFELPGGWYDLMLRYAGMGQSNSLDELLRVTIGHESPTLAQIESGYIDEDFRDEYVNFYAKTYREIPSRCERLHFFVHSSPESEDYVGFVVLRPVIGRPVCRTLIRPPRHLRDSVSCLATGTATPWGYRKSIRCFPYISQDSQFGSCAHAALWMISLYFHLRFRRPRYHLSDFAQSARLHQDVHPAVPSGGLSLRQISAVLHDLDMTPVVYPLDQSLPDSAEGIACRYLNSGLPVMLLSEGAEAGHAQVLIGYGRDDYGLFFIYHDDQSGPYQVVRELPRSVDEEARGRDHKTINALIVPMPGRIYLSGEAAEAWANLIFKELIEQHVKDQPGLGQLADGLDGGQLRLRSYLTEVADYKRALRSRDLPDDVVVWHSGISTSHWLWIVELQDRGAADDGPRCVIGEIAIDATSDDNWINPLFGNLPGITVFWPSLGDDIEIADSIQDGTPYLSGSALHVRSDERDG
jgi:hypothetical protein